MRALIFVSSAAIGGTERMTITLANHLQTVDCRVLLVLNTGGALQGELNPTVEMIRLGTRRVRYAILPLARLIRRWRPDVVFAPKPDVAIGLALAWRLAGRAGKLILRESNHRSAQGMPRRGLFAWALRWAYGQANVVVAPTKAVARDVIDRHALDPARVRVLANPIDLERVRAAGSVTVPRPPQSDRNGATLVAIGRFVRQKGFDVLLKALAQLHDPRVHLTIIGEGPEREALSRLAHQLGVASQVVMPGASQNPYPDMAHADICVLPSRWEGFPNALIEAMACGCAVVATRCLSGPEEIITHEHDGLLCEVESPQALADQLRRVMSDRALARRLGSAAQETSQRFDARRIAAGYLALFQEGSPVVATRVEPQPHEVHGEQAVVS